MRSTRLSKALGPLMLGTLLAVAGCAKSANVASTAGTSLTRGLSADNRYTGVGLYGSGTIQAGCDEGGFLGGELEGLSSMFSDAPFGSRWRASLLAGYAWTPLPHRPRLGFEIYGHGGGGRMPAGDGTSTTWVWGPRIGVPIRLAPSVPIWDAERTLWPTWMLVPSAGANFYVPSEAGADSAVRSELTVHLAFRLHLWSSLVP
ncbi:MAG: hypothetical protein ACOC1F_02600 [Myxococcota bacterium]